MSSLRKTQSARANGATSRGPATPEGRRNSAQSNLTHGLTAQTVCLTNESIPRFEQMHQQYFDEWQPAGPTETDLVEEMVVAKWNQRRCWSMQTATLDLRMEMQRTEIEKKFSQMDQPGCVALAFAAEADQSKSLPLLLRYEAAHRRAYDRALHNLRQLQAARKAAEAETPSVSILSDTPPAPDSGFTKEPNPKIEHPIKPQLCVCGRLTSPKWNRCKCGNVLRHPEQENE